MSRGECLAAALDWLRAQNCTLFILRGERHHVPVAVPAVDPGDGAIPLASRLVDVGLDLPDESDVVGSVERPARLSCRAGDCVLLAGGFAECDGIVERRSDEIERHRLTPPAEMRIAAEDEETFGNRLCVADDRSDERR